jgi:hypothetical protein
MGYQDGVTPTFQSLVAVAVWSWLLAATMLIAITVALRRGQVPRVFITWVSLGSLVLWAVFSLKLIAPVTVTTPRGTLTTCGRGPLAESGIFGSAPVDVGPCHDAGVHESLLLVGVPTLGVGVGCLLLLFPPNRRHGMSRVSTA